MNFVYSMKSVGALSLNVAETKSNEPTLVMLHGVTRRWQTFLPIVAPMAARHRLVLVDFRGHGHSDRGVDGYAVTNYVQDICELIRQHVDGPVALYGHSLGAMTVAGVAAILGERVSAIVMEDPPFDTMGTRISQTPLLNYFSEVSQFAGLDAPISQIAARLGAAEHQDPNSGQTFRIGDTRDAAQLYFSASCLARLDPAVFESILSGNWLSNYDVNKVFASLACPALLLQADCSAGGMLTEEDATHVGQLNSNVVTVPFSGVAHGIHWTATSQLLNVVLPFLESVR